MVTVLQFVFKLYITAVDLPSYAFGAHLGMYVKCEVEQGGAHGQLSHFPLWSEHKYLISVETWSYVSEEVASLLLHCSKDFTHLCHPGIESALALDALVAEVRGEAFLGYFIHAPGSYLNLHPAAGRCHHSDVERFVTVCPGHRDPVAHPAWVRLVNISHHGIDLPA